MPVAHVSYRIRLRQALYLLLLLLKFKAHRIPVSVAAILLLPSNFWLFEVLSRVGSATEDTIARKIVGAGTFPGQAVVSSNGDFSKQISHLQAMAAGVGPPSSSWLSLCDSPQSCNLRFYRQVRPQAAGSLLARINYDSSGFQVDCASLPAAELACPFLHQLVLQSLSPEGRVFQDVKFLSLTDTSDESKVERKSRPVTICSRVESAGSAVTALMHTVLYHMLIATAGCMVHFTATTIAFISGLKENGFLQLMFSNGLSVGAYWSVIIVSIAVECALFSAIIGPCYGLQCPEFYPAGSASKLALIFFAYCFSLASLSILATVIFRSFFLIVVATVAIIISVVTMTVVGLTRLLTMGKTDYLMNMLLMFPPGHVAQYALYLLQPESSFQWQEVQKEYLDRVPSGMITFPIVVTLLTIYADCLLSSGNGMSLPPTFPFSRSFWMPKVAKVAASMPTDCSEDRDGSKSHIEPVPAGLPAIYINDISVCYNRGCCTLDNQQSVVQALDSISCIVYQDQITALIGHNGAGKTTLIRALTGELTPTSGKAVIGDQLVTDPYQRMTLRRIVSTCGQTNMLCQQLTVMESINLATLSKGFTLESQLDSTASMMEQLGLADKADVQAVDLSGGQLRKLCCIIALLGDPRIVMLDEPTSGLDPVSRRRLWRILQDRRQGRCIILCTQFMDEADVLADRKLFLSGGRLVCAGSSLFLKHMFGCCPTISVSLRSNKNAESFMKLMPHGVKLLKQSGTELQLSVSASGGDASSELHVLAEAVKRLEVEQKHKESPVEAFGVSQANLDEIFLRLENVDTTCVESAIKTRRLASIVSLPGPDEEAETPAATVNQSLLQLQIDFYKANKLRRSFRRTFVSLLTMNLRRQVRSPVQALCRLVMPLVLLAVVGSVAYVEKMRYQLSLSVAKHLTMDGHRMSSGELLKDSIQQTKSEFVRLPVFPRFSAMDNIVCLYDTKDQEEFAKKGCMSVTEEKFTFNLAIKPKSVSVDEFVLPSDDQLNPDLQKYCVEGCFILYATPWDINHLNVNRSIVIAHFWRQARPSDTLKSMTNFFIRLWRFFVPKATDSQSGIQMTTVIPFSQYYSIHMELFVLVLLFSIIPVTFMSDPVEDRSTCVRQQMSVMGLSSKVYWFNTFVIHWIQYAVFAILSAVVCLVWDRYHSVFLLCNVWIPMLLLGTVSNLLCVYCIGALQRTPSYSVLAIYLFFVLFVLSVITFVMNNRIAGAVCTWLVPPLAPMMLAFTAMKMASYGLLYFERDHIGDIPEFREVFLAYPDTRHALIAMCIHILLLSVILIAIENWSAIYSLTQKHCTADARRSTESSQQQQQLKEDDEEGVRQEAERVLQSPRSDRNLLEVRGVEKVYPNGVHAVRGVTFGGLTGEVFGLLGQNGAGKTTLMSSIVGQLAATRGEVEVHRIDGNWLNSCLGTRLGIIGFCPQHDPLFRRVTVEEHLLFYARIRGIPELLVFEQTDRLIRGLGLVEHKFKVAKELSGGNKRRLCLAIALLGCPSIVVIDEASTGVDPENKRAIWRAIRGLAEGGRRTVVVTTHSMEEVEALCSRVGIMDRGGMIGFGTVQQLRSRHGKAYTLEALLPLSQDVGELSVLKASVKAAILNKFSQAVVLDDVGASVQFQIPTNSVDSLSDSIRWLADKKTSLNVQYFSLHQMSLDQIFVNMMRHHAETDDAVESLARPKTGWECL